MRSEGGGAFRGGARQTGGGSCGFGRGEVRGGRVGCGRAHLGLDLGGEDLGEEARRRGVEFGKNSNGGRDGNVRFGRDSAQTGTGWSGDGGRQGCAALGVTNRGGVASSGRRGGRRRLCSARVVRARGKGKTALDGKLRGLRARGEERCSGAIADSWKRRRRAQSPVWPASTPCRAQ